MIDSRLPPGTRPSLLLVEDDSAVRRGLQLLLQGQGFDVRAFASSRTALADAMLAEAQFLVIDYRLADMDGVAMLRALREQGWNGVAVLITAFPSHALCEAASAAGFAAVLDKPFRDDDLLRALRR